MKYLHGHWGSSALPPQSVGAPFRCLVEDQYDLIIGSDLLYERDANAVLAGFIALHSSPAAEVWIVDPDRDNRPAFNRHMAANGFCLREEQLKETATDVAPAYKGRVLIYRRAAAIADVPRFGPSCASSL